MARVAPGVQVAHRHRLDPLMLQDRDRAAERGPVEWRLDPAVGAQPLTHAEPQPARHQLLRRRQAQIVAVVLEPLAHLDHVAMAFGGQEADPRAGALQERVGRDRGAVNDPLGLGEQRRALAAEPLRQQTEPVEHAARGVVRGRRDFLQDRAAAIVGRRHQIGKGAADIDADAVHSLTLLPMIGMAGEDLLRPIKLLEEHAANQEMRPGHRPQR